MKTILILLLWSLTPPSFASGDGNQCNFLQSRDQTNCVTCLRVSGLGAELGGVRNDCSGARAGGTVLDQRQIRGVTQQPPSLCRSSWQFVNNMRTTLDPQVNTVCSRLIASAGRVVPSQAGAQGQVSRLSQESAAPLQELIRRLEQEKQNATHRREAHHQEMAAALDASDREPQIVSLRQRLKESRERDRQGFTDETQYQRAQREARALYTHANPNLRAFGHQLVAANALARLQQQIDGELTKKRSSLAQITGVGAVAAGRQEGLGRPGGNEQPKGRGGGGLFDTNTLMALAPLGLMAAGMMMQQRNQQKSDVTAGQNSPQNPNGGPGGQQLPNREIAGSSLGEPGGTSKGSNGVEIGSASSGKNSGVLTGKGDTPLFGTVPVGSQEGSPIADSFKSELGGFPFSGKSGGSTGGSPQISSGAGTGTASPPADLESVINSAGAAEGAKSDGHTLGVGGGGGGFGGGSAGGGSADGAFKDPFKVEGDHGALAAAALDGLPALDGANTLSALSLDGSSAKVGSPSEEGVEEQNRSLFSRVRDSHRRCLKRGCVTAGLASKI